MPTPLILMAIERTGWCFHNIANAVQQALSEHYQFRVVLSSRVAKETCDVLVALCWERALYMKGNTHCRGMVTCLYDHLSWCINDDALAHFRLTLRHSAALGVCNKRMEAEVRARVPASELPPVFLLEDGVDTGAFRLVPPPDKFACGWTGTSTRCTPGGPDDYKGLGILREACAQAGATLRILDAAAGGQWPHARMPVFYQDISVQLVGSAYEGTPNPLLEALSMGRPVVTTPVGLAPELIKNGETGYLVERSEGPAGFAERIRALAALRREELAQMGQKCRHAAAEYDWAKKARAWKQCLDLALLGTDVARAAMTKPVEVAQAAGVVPGPAAPEERLRAGLVELPTSVPPPEPLPRPPRPAGAKPRVLLISDVRDWAFHQNMRDLEEHLRDRFDFSHWFVIDYVNKAPPPDLEAYDVVFCVYHRWPILHLIPWDRTVGSLRALWFKPETPAPPDAEDIALVNRFRAFHVVTRKNMQELAEAGCPGAVYLTNPVNMTRFPEATSVADRLVASWNGNAKHRSGANVDVKGFYSTVRPACQFAQVPLEYAEYNTQRLTPAEMPAFYLKANVALCASLYEGSCAVGSTPVILADGSPQRIDEVCVGDRVIARDGSVQTVLSKWSEGTPETIVEVTLWGGKKLKFTPNHRWPVWSWLRECACGCGQSVTQGRLWVQNHSAPDSRRPKNVHVHGDANGTSSSYKAIPEGYLPYKMLRTDALRVGDFLLIPRKYTEVPTSATTADARLLGYYIAEGTLLHGRCGDYGADFAFGKHELETWIPDVQALLLARGVESTVRPSPTTGAVRIRTKNPRGGWKRRRGDKNKPIISATTLLVRWLRQHAAEGAARKRLSAEVMGWPLPLKRELVAGMYRGDGTQTWKRPSAKCNGVSFCVYYDTVSSTLATQLQLILAQLGFAAGMCEVAPREVPLKINGGRRVTLTAPRYHLSVTGAPAVKLAEMIWQEHTKANEVPGPARRRQPKTTQCMIEDAFVCLPIKAIRTTVNNEAVHNLTVSGDHSYLVDNVATYNSNSVAEAMAAGQAVISTRAGNIEELHDSQVRHFGESGIMLVDDREVGTFVVALKELQADLGRVRAMGAINREEIASRWSWTAWAARYADFLMRAL